VREIKLEGCQKIEQETLLSLIKIEGMPNLFTIRLSELAKRLETHPWIDQVKMRKVFPNKILIQVEERKPIAILHLEELYYIDTKGEIFSPVGEKDEYNYPFLTGLSRQALEKDPTETKRLVAMALELLTITNQGKSPPLEEISEIQMEKNFGIQCYSKVEEVAVRMGWEHFGEKLKRLSVVWRDLQRRGFTSTLIDCSDMERMVVKKVTRREK
jgi:cell division protein FtsQ